MQHMQGRGVCISLAPFGSEMEVQRGGRRFSIQTKYVRATMMQFQGRTTDRFLYCCRRGYDASLVLIDLEYQTCNFLYRFPNFYASKEIVLTALASSGCGRTVAVTVREDQSEYSGRGFWGFVHVATFDAEGRFVTSLRTYSCEDLGSDDAIPVFLGHEASELVIVNGDGDLFRVGYEDSKSCEMKFCRMPEYLGHFLDSHAQYVHAACSLTGTDSFLIFVVHSSLQRTWEVRWIQQGTNEQFFSRVVFSSKGTGIQWTAVEAISHATGVGVMLHTREQVHIFSVLTMELGPMRQAWMQACIRVGRKNVAIFSI